MALETQLIELPFTQGLDSRSNPHLTSRPSRCENMVFRDGSLQAKHSGTAQATVDDTGTTITAASGLAALAEKLIRAGALASGTLPLHVLGTGAAKWTQRQNVPPFCTVGRKPLQQGPNKHTNFDWASGSNVTVVVWVEMSGVATQQGLFACAYDETSGALLVRPTELASSTRTIRHPRVVVAGNGSTIHVYWIDATGGATDLKLSTLTTATPTSFSAATTIRTDAEWYFDAVSAGSNVVVCYRTAGGATYTLIQTNAAGTVAGSPAPTTAAAVAGGPYPSLALARDSSGNLWVLYTNMVVVDLRVHNSSFAVTAGPLAVDAALGFYRATMSVSGSTATAFYEAGGDGANTIKVAVFSTTAITTAAAVVARGVRLTTEAVQPSTSGAPAMVGVVNCTLGVAVGYQPTGFILAASGAVVGRFLAGFASQQYSEDFQRKPRPFTTSGGWATVFPETLRLQALNGVLTALNPGITRIDVTVVNLNGLPRVQIGDWLFVGGAKPYLFDGFAFVESGFHLFPEELSVTATGAGNLSNGSYLFKACYEWTDAMGTHHRSAPSPPLTVAAAAASSKTIQIPTLRLTDRTYAGAKVFLVLYRTEVNGSTFYRDSSASTPTLNDTAVNSLTIVSTQSDANLILNEPLYAQNGILEGIATPACKFACVHGKRLVVGGLENPYELRYSTEVGPGSPPRFNEVLSLEVPPRNGVVTGVASMDGKIIIQCERGFWVVSGDGPNEAGEQNTFSEPQDILAGLGCSDFRANTELPGIGLVFRSSLGLRLLRRDLVVDPAWGVEMDTELASNTVLAGALLKDQPHARWMTATRHLVYDYLYRQWSTFLYGGTDALVWDGAWTRATGTATYKETTTGYGDPSDSVPTYTVETPWLKVAGIQGLQRIRRALLLGRVGSDATVILDVAYDYEDYDIVNDRTTAFTTPYVLNGVFQLRHHFRRQKCEAVRFRIIQTTLGGNGRVVMLTALSLEVAVRRGAFKGLSAAKTV